MYQRGDTVRRRWKTEGEEKGVCETNCEPALGFNMMRFCSRSLCLHSNLDMVCGTAHRDRRRLKKQTIFMSVEKKSKIPKKQQTVERAEMSCPMLLLLRALCWYRWTKQHVVPFLNVTVENRQEKTQNWDKFEFLGLNFGYMCILAEFDFFVCQPRSLFYTYHNQRAHIPFSKLQTRYI